MLVAGTVAAIGLLCACAPTMALTTATHAAPQADPSSAPAPSAAPTVDPRDREVSAARGASAPRHRATPLPSAKESPTPEAASEPQAGTTAESVPPQQGSSPASPSGVDVPITTQAAPFGSFVLGDSVILSPGVGPALQQRGYIVAGTVGQGVSNGYLIDYLATEAAQSAPAWVIELGTNNSGDPGTVAALAGWVDLIDSLRNPDSPQHVYWVLPYRPAEYDGAMSAYPLDAFDAELVRLAGERKWLTTLDFASAAQANPQWFDADAAMHLHPDPAGQEYLLRLIAGG